MNKADENPFKALVDLHKRMAQTAGYQAEIGIGRIVSPPPELIVSYNGMNIDKRFLWVDEYWIQGHTRTHKGHIVSATQPRGGGGGYAEFASHTHDINDDYTDTETITDTWKKDDYVLMLPILGNDKKSASEYVVLGKLVRLDGN